MYLHYTLKLYNTLMNDTLPNCVPQEVYKPDDYQEPEDWFEQANEEHAQAEYEEEVNKELHIFRLENENARLKARVEFLTQVNSNLAAKVDEYMIELDKLNEERF